MFKISSKNQFYYSNENQNSTLNSREINISIEGMSCASCVNHVEKALKAEPGVISASVNLATEKAHVVIDTNLNVSNLVSAIERAGYKGIIIEAEPNSSGAKKNLKV